jgi:hypothetical protein
MIIEIILILSVSFNIILLVGVNRATSRIEVYNDIYSKLYHVVKTSHSALKELDDTGSFEADDEVGYFFNTLKTVQNTLDSSFVISIEGEDGEYDLMGDMSGKKEK